MLESVKDGSMSRTASIEASSKSFEHGAFGSARSGTSPFCCCSERRCSRVAVTGQFSLTVVALDGNIPILVWRAFMWPRLSPRWEREWMVMH